MLEAEQGIPVGERFGLSLGGLLVIVANEEIGENEGVWVGVTKVCIGVTVGTDNGHLRGS